ncbi:MAG: hypothetical protein Q9162_006190 [Coniocarpon cinnabarinum]
MFGDEFELFECYRPGGLHPVHLGEIYKARYEIVYKLGWGTHATIWMARDLVSERFVCLKFIAANASRDSREERILRFLEERKTGLSPGGDQCHVIELYDSFESTSANGTHLVIVQNLVAPLRVWRPSKKEELGLLARHLIHGLAFLHSNGVAHIDLHASNIGYKVQLTEEDFGTLPKLEEYAFKDLNTDVKWTSQFPRCWYKHEDWDEMHAERDTPDKCFQIFDFGHATASSLGDASVSPLLPFHEPPEMRLAKERPIHHKVDLWAVGCLVFAWEFHDLFDRMFVRTKRDYVRQLLCIEDSLPERWQDLGDAALASVPPARDQQFAGLSWAEIPCCNCTIFGFGSQEPLETRTDHVNACKDFVLKLLALDPARRSEASDLFAHPYLQSLE